MSAGIEVDGSEWGSGVRQTLYDFLSDGQFCDTTIISSDNQPVNAHSCLIAAASPVLRDLMANGDSESATITASISCSVWQIILKFIYIQKVTITPQDAFALKDIYRAARILKLKGLQEALKNKFVPQLLVPPGTDLDSDDDMSTVREETEEEDKPEEEEHDSDTDVTESEEEDCSLSMKCESAGTMTPREKKYAANMESKNVTYEDYLTAVEKSRFCAYCAKYCKTGRMKVLHYMNHLKEKTFQRDFKKKYSNVKFFAMLDFVERQCSVNAKMKSLCWRCQKFFSSRQLYNEHMWARHENVPFECTFCEEKYPYHSQLLLHKRKKHARKVLK